MKLSIAFIVFLCPACSAKDLKKPSDTSSFLQLDHGALTEPQYVHHIKTQLNQNRGCRMSEAPVEQERFFSARGRHLQQWHRCKPEIDADADEGVNAVPEDWILANTSEACGNGKRGLLLINGGDAGAGFSTEFFLYMINHILLAERRCLEPVINMNCAGAPLWFDPVSRQNPWEWYFEPLKVAQDTPSTAYRLTSEQKTTMHAYVAWSVHSGYYGCVGIDAHDFDEAWFRQQRSLGHRVVQQYFVVKPGIVHEVQELWDAHFSGAAQVLGMHYRGGDKEGVWRAGFDNVSAYLDYATAFLAAYPRGRIMLATDDTKVANEMLNGTWPAAVKNGLVVPENIMKGYDKAFNVFSPTSPVATELRGRACLLDILLLAKSNFLIYGQSTVVESVFYVNSNLHNSSIPIWFQGRPKATREWFLSHGDQTPSGDQRGDR